MIVIDNSLQLESGPDKNTDACNPCLGQSLQHDSASEDESEISEISSVNVEEDHSQEGDDYKQTNKVVLELCPDQTQVNFSPCSEIFFKNTIHTRTPH